MSATDPGTYGAAPPNCALTAVETADGLHPIGFVPMLIWPAIIGLVINYAKRGDSDSFLDSHHRWLIRTFWFALLGYAHAFGVVVALAEPAVAAAIRSADTRDVISIDWGAPFAMIGGATAGALGVVAVWAWMIDRLVRGRPRLQDARPVP